MANISKVFLFQAKCNRNEFLSESLEIQREDFDQATGEKEYVMIWSQK